MLKEAMEYATLKYWFVFPCHYMHNRKCSCGNVNCKSPGKHPLTKHGFKDASNDIVQIKKWWSQWPSANIGVATGLNSNIIVIDVDPKNGGEHSLYQVLGIAGEQKETLTAQTGGHKNGRHYYYLHPGGRILTIHGVCPGLDIKSCGGYVIAPPSKHESGRTYRWLNRSPIAALPTWVYSLIHKSKADNRLLSKKFSRFKKFKGTKINVHDIPITMGGGRNNTLFKLCCKMIALNYEQDEAEETLQEINDLKLRDDVDARGRPDPKPSKKEVTDLVNRLYRRYK